MATSGFVGSLAAPVGRAGPPDFHHAPLSAASLENPYRGQPPAAQAGGQLYAAHCAACHGRSAEGTGSIPALAHGRVQNVPDGEVFWFITRGSLSGAMPSWASLPEQQRWQLVTYLKTLVSAPIVAPAPVAALMTPITAPPPPAPFTDFRLRHPASCVPNGDAFVAESGGGQIRVFSGLNADGKPERSEIFAGNLNKPYGIAFYPAGPDPQWPSAR
jgi:mono/diheme cytochrome c family protein